MTPQELLELFRIPDDPMHNVYLLGCFARGVTLYSQQVRALNLIYALHKTKELAPGCEVAIVGAGAAGLMAAAATVHLGAQVTVFEKLQSPMELQRSSRLRWIHPFIYDWPNDRNPGNRANLPFLDWEAGYAENVAEQIEGQWNTLVASPQYKIHTYWNVDPQSLTFSTYDGATFVHGSGLLGTNRERRGFDKKFDLLILAVGFGVEPEYGARSSYWSDDNIDGGFQTNRDEQEWLVSGCGDGGLTDLMRLCIHRFRHERVISIFLEMKGVEAVKDILTKAHTEELPKIARKHDQEVFLSKLFGGIQEHFDLLPDYERSLHRLHKPKIYLTGSGPSPYGPNSSILNRLIISQLSYHGAFQYIQGPAKVVQTTVDQGDVKRVVEFDRGQTRIFDRVIERHGTEQSIIHPCFESFRTGIESLRQRWGQIPAVGDMTREKLWDLDYFGTGLRLEATTSRQRDFASDVKKVGVRAGCFTVMKQVGNDGSSTLHYQFEKLSALSGHLTQVHILFSTLTGTVGPLKLDSEAIRLGLRWVPEDSRRAPRNLAEKIAQRRRMSGQIVLPNALTPATSSITFGFSFQVFNGDALSKWEFSQMYSPENHVHFNGESLKNEIEYLSRIVWFPADTLKMKLTLPSSVSTPPFLSVFRSQDRTKIPKDEIIDNDGVLRIFPPTDSQFNPDQREKGTSWKRIVDPLLAEAGISSLSNTAPQTWELTVANPTLGSCYSLDWVLNAPSEFLSSLAKDASRLRIQLLQHRKERIAHAYGNDAVRDCFKRLHADMRKVFKPRRVEGFEVSVMTYDESLRALVHVEGLLSGDELSKQIWKTRIPFGLGVAGACYKEAEIFLHLEDSAKEDGWPIYITLPELHPHKCLVSIPLDHPGFSRQDTESVQDRSMQCLGVVNVGSFVENKRMRDMPFLVKELTEISQRFASTLYDRLQVQD